MTEINLEGYWNTIPVGKKNAVDYPTLCIAWDMKERAVRNILHKLSLYDNGDNYILMRSSGTKGFYKTDDPRELKRYKKECLNKGRSVFAPVKKINRVLTAQGDPQYSFENNLRVIREGLGMPQSAVCYLMQKHDASFDVPMLSKMENGYCMPTPYHLILLAQIYEVEPSELVTADLY